MPRLDSLRVQLVASMLFVFLIGVGAARFYDQHTAALGSFDLDLVREPYQDVLVLVAFSLGAIVLIWLVSGWNLRPLATAAREAALFGPANLDARLSTEKLPREIRPLVDAVNAALGRLAEAYEAERRFVSRAAHELRTPLAVLSLRLQRSKRDGALDWQALEGDMAQLSRLVGQLLDLARKEYARQTATSGATVNLSRIAREAAAAMLPMIEQNGRVLDVALPVALMVRGRPDDLRDLLRNLLDNALVHGRGAIRLSAQTESGARGTFQVAVIVSDEGPGVPAALQEEMFERFHKGAAHSPGHGLGLAIVREVAQGHSGFVSFLPGPGCRVRLVLPLPEDGPLERMPAPARM